MDDLLRHIKPSYIFALVAVKLLLDFATASDLKEVSDNVRRMGTILDSVRLTQAQVVTKLEFFEKHYKKN